jgi:hypothetical protein
MAHSGAQHFVIQDNYGYIGGKGALDGEDLGPVSTEWEDALAKHKIISKFERLETVDEKNTKFREQAKTREEELEEKDLEELAELEDELEERDIFSLRRERMKAMKEAAAKNKFGSIRQISEPEFVHEVSNSSLGGNYVICCLFKHTDELNIYGLKCLAQVARRHQDVKFVKIGHKECIHNYPDMHTPTLLVYHDGGAIGHIKRDQLGGYGMTADTLEWDLSLLGCYKTDQDENPTKKFAKLKGRKKGEAMRKAAYKQETGGCESDSDDLLDL